MNPTAMPSVASLMHLVMLAALSLALLAPAFAQTAPPGYSAFTKAPVPSIAPGALPPVDRAGAPNEVAGPTNATPFSAIPPSSLDRSGGQISPADRDTGRTVLPSLSR